MWWAHRPYDACNDFSSQKRNKQVEINSKNDEARAEVRNVVEPVARGGENSVITYKEVVMNCACLRELPEPQCYQYLGRLLGEINLEEDFEGRGMLSSVVVGKDDKIPGMGYFDFARYVLQRDIDISTEEGRLRFFNSEIRRIWGEWSIAH